jgi:hypothetical protein
MLSALPFAVTPVFLHPLQGRQCTLSVASNGDVIAAVSAGSTTAAAATTRSPPTAQSKAAAGAAAAAAAFELKGSGWQTLVKQQGVGSIRVLQEHEFNPEVGNLHMAGFR